MIPNRSIPPVTVIPALAYPDVGEAARWMCDVFGFSPRLRIANHRVRSPADHPFGERQYTVQDFAGHVWTFTQSIADVDPASWGGVSG